jgi:hypothetical protein
VNKFSKAIQNLETQKNLVEALYKEITSDPITEALVKTRIGSREVYEFLTSLIAKPPIPVILVEDKSDEIDEVLDSLPKDTKIIGFATFQRKDVGLGVHAHLFEPLHTPRVQLGKLTDEEEMRMSRLVQKLSRRFLDKQTNVWAGFSSKEKERYRLHGVELVKQKVSDEVVFLAYLMDSDLKKPLEERGYLEWFSDSSKGSYYLHEQSENAKSHVLLLRTTKDKLDVTTLENILEKLIHDIDSIK